LAQSVRKVNLVLQATQVALDQLDLLDQSDLLVPKENQALLDIQVPLALQDLLDLLVKLTRHQP
jgi:hypothetical protein